jgi:hypothetical protein
MAPAKSTQVSYRRRAKNHSPKLCKLLSQIWPIEEEVGAGHGNGVGEYCFYQYLVM